MVSSFFWFLQCYLCTLSQILHLTNLSFSFSIFNTGHIAITSCISAYQTEIFCIHLIFFYVIVPPPPPYPLTGKVTQVVYGHWDTVTCLSRSECPVGGDCYIVSGARDATLLVWHWSAKVQWVLGDNHVQGNLFVCVKMFPSITS